MQFIKKVWEKLYFYLEFPIRYIWGRDIFISYSRRDTFDYPENLVLALQERVWKEVQEKKIPKTKLSFYLDKFVAPPDGKLPRSLIRHLRWSRMLVILCTEKAFAPNSFVTAEVGLFSRLGRKVILVNVDNALSNVDFKESPWKDISGTSWEDESLEAVQNSKPSENVIVRILESAKFTRQDKRLKQSVWATALSVLILLGTGALVSYAFVKNAWDEVDYANTQAIAAELKVEEANSKVLEAEDKVIKANEDAERITEKAEQEVANAKTREDNANKKAEDATKLADQQTKLAQVKTKLADEKTQLADAETERANAASMKAKQAEMEFAQSQNNLAENYYNISQTSALKNISQTSALNNASQTSALDAVQALPWAQKAIETLPDGIEDQNLYKLWALNLTKDIPQLIINPSDKVIHKPIFDPKGKYVITVLSSGKLEMWNLKTGERKATPLDNCKCEIANSTHYAAFSPDGKYVAVLAGYDTTIQGFPVFKLTNFFVWDVKTEEVKLKAEGKPFVDTGIIVGTNGGR